MIEVTEPKSIPPVPTSNNVICPECNTHWSMPGDIVNQMLQCAQCNEKFHYDEGFLTWLAKSDPLIVFILPLRRGLLQMGTETVKVGEVYEVPLKQKFYKITGVFLGGKSPTLTEYYNDGEVVAIPIPIGTERLAIVSSRKISSSQKKEIEVRWTITGTATDEPVPIWHIFLQNSVDLINKQEFGASIVASLMAFDAFLGNTIAEKLKAKSISPELIKKTVLSAKFLRAERLSYWLKELFGKSFKESGFNPELKDVADLRNKIVHPSLDSFNEKTLSTDVAKNALITVIKSMKWTSDLSHNRLH